MSSQKISSGHDPVKCEPGEFLRKPRRAAESSWEAAKKRAAALYRLRRLMSRKAPPGSCPCGEPAKRGGLCSMHRMMAWHAGEATRTGQATTEVTKATPRRTTRTASRHPAKTVSRTTTRRSTSAGSRTTSRSSGGGGGGAGDDGPGEPPPSRLSAPFVPAALAMEVTR